MKKLVITILALLFSMSAFSQDFIILRNGDMIQSMVQEISSTEIKYKKFSNLNGPMYVVNISEVLSINFENGEKEVFDKPAAAPAETAVVAAVPAAPAIEIGLPDEEYNKQLIESLNDWHAQFNGKISKNPKEAYFAYCKLNVSDDSEVANKDLELDFISGRENNVADGVSGWMLYGYYIKFVLKNRTDKTIYIDLGNTFFYRGELSSPFYIPSVTSVSSGDASGASVNLGGIANAVGLGNTAIGALAGAVNVGGGKSNVNTTTTYSQRVIAIAPYSSKVLDQQFIFSPEFQSEFPGFRISQSSLRPAAYYIVSSPIVKYDKHAVRNGKLLEWDSSDSPVKLAFFLTYSFDETFQHKANLKTSLFLSEALCHCNGSKVLIPDEAKLFFQIGFTNR